MKKETEPRLWGIRGPLIRREMRPINLWKATKPLIKKTSIVVNIRCPAALSEWAEKYLAREWNQRPTRLSQLSLRSKEKEKMARPVWSWRSLLPRSTTIPANDTPRIMDRDVIVVFYFSRTPNRTKRSTWIFSPNFWMALSINWAIVRSGFLMKGCSSNASDSTGLVADTCIAIS